MSAKNGSCSYGSVCNHGLVIYCCCRRTIAAGAVCSRRQNQRTAPPLPAAVNSREQQGTQTEGSHDEVQRQVENSSILTGCSGAGCSPMLCKARRARTGFHHALLGVGAAAPPSSDDVIYLSCFVSSLCSVVKHAGARRDLVSATAVSQLHGMLQKKLCRLTNQYRADIAATEFISTAYIAMFM